MENPSKTFQSFFSLSLYSHGKEKKDSQKIVPGLIPLESQ